MAGYWRQAGDQWQWVGGYWTNAPQANAEQEVTYYPAPPAPPSTAPIGEPPASDTFYVPGSWVWTGDRYVWRSGYWAKVQPGYVWVPGHYRWTPGGYIYVAGYWDYAIAQRGVLFAPVVVDPAVVGVGFVYTPTFVVRDRIIIDSLFVRPTVGFYYFGDYYGPRYVGLGFTTCVVYSRSHYEPIFAYRAWEYRLEWLRRDLLDLHLVADLLRQGPSLGLVLRGQHRAPRAPGKLACEGRRAARC